MTVLVCGDRDWDDRETVRKWLKRLPSGTHVIHGACRGADLQAAEVAEELGFTTQGYPADWEKHGKAAGPLRNREMLDLKPDMVIAFHKNLKKSRGTLDCVLEANRRGIRVELISS